MDIVVKGRNVEVPDHYRVHVADKLSKVERYDQKIQRIDVELFHERNPRQVERCQHVEITCVSRGPVVRAEAISGDFYSALDLASTKLEQRLRRAADRRRVHRGRRAPVSVAAATAGLAFAEPPPMESAVLEESIDKNDDEPWTIVREKEFSSEPMTIDDALYQMELVGHDFFLFNDKETGRPSVVYRRKAYDYGVITLAP
ncbi:MAG: ribosome-associated translation inhibitor RaiA [Hamadaea sp.]|uniref:ribosome hibernation-promoting factor, HPF/YfiA family n=1 Tax=Hamadaea sp. TaxID=2024425 RepID=UPI0018137BD8|nr:ribosome-associated translation inhibitor RaiA [Hamadaea sp.]NUR70750.1 ribosome-associated translation inhibitor RaiA [Hamadaea sp.]NUT23936.1 ribosome-associated translation inhibitor RaiA [Hamadaea sp.]